MSDGLPQPRRRLAVLAIALASMMGTLDVNIANTALPTIARDLGVTPATSIWIVNAYQIASVATLFTFAALGQLYGPARIYRLGVLVFIAASLVCTFSHTFGLLILGRVLQGFGDRGCALQFVDPGLVDTTHKRNLGAGGRNIDHISGKQLEIVRFVAPAQQIVEVKVDEDAIAAAQLNVAHRACR